MSQTARQIISDTFLRLVTNLLGDLGEKSLDEKIAIRDALQTLAGDYTSSIDLDTNS